MTPSSEEIAPNKKRIETYEHCGICRRIVRASTTARIVLDERVMDVCPNCQADITNE